MPRALITGAAGFIGNGLVRRLLGESWEVHALLGRACPRETLAEVADRLTIHDHDGSMASMLAILAASRPDVVIHLASQFLSEHRPEDVQGLIVSNILFATQLVEAMAATGTTRMVNTGTSWQHFQTPGYRPVNLYAATKQAFEDILAYYHDALGFSCITLKLYDTFGPGDRRRKLINILLDAAATGEPVELSPGRQEIELSHVDDVTSAFRVAALRVMAATAPIRESFLVPGTRLTVRDLVARLEAASGRPIHAAWGARPYRPREVMKPIAGAERLPGWRPKVDMDSALLAALAAWRS